ncbi:hypothetical protein TNCV_3614451 [Trichonephila clavipes]|uniref:Uncharacterized protein n=1 Tax=Trichonephila clavipes TaxID=2585209 RepID=A0A8X6STQ8_TRICX|nr:hypothetical protein TNCV_3614451 [Trichonephila clavipes]
MPSSGEGGAVPPPEDSGDSQIKPVGVLIGAAVAQWLRHPTMAGMSCVRSQYRKDPPCRAAMHVKSVES